MAAVKKRILYIDILRIFACYLVILTHSVRPVTDMSLGIYLGLLSFLGSPSSELFLSLSGAVLLPVKTTFKKFYKRRFLKLLPPLFFWSVIMLVLYYVLGQKSLAEILELLLFMPLLPVHGVYWFVYVMIGLYLFAPFISKWMEVSSKKQIEWFFFLWLINLILPYLNLLFPGKFMLNDSHYWALNYFGGFLGYWLLGYYLRLYPVKIGRNFRFLFILGGSVLYIFLIAYARLYTDWYIPAMYDNLQFGSAFLVALLYTLAQSIKIKSEKLERAINDVANMSFGIYLIHFIVVRYFVWSIFGGFQMHPFIDTFLISTLSFFISYVIVKCISYLPFSKYLIGV